MEDDAQKGPSVGLRLWRFVAGALVVYLTATAIGTLFGIQYATWADLFRLFAIPYDLLIDTPFSKLQNWTSSLGIHIPDWLRDSFVLWIVLGRLVRRSIHDMVARSDDKHWRYNSSGPRPTWRHKLSKWFRTPYQALKEWWRDPLTQESIKWTIFPPWRLWVDLRGDHVEYKLYDDDHPYGKNIKEFRLTIYWNLSPFMVLRYLLASLFVLSVLCSIDMVLYCLGVRGYGV